MEPYLSGAAKPLFDRWHAALLERFLRDLTYQEIRKGVQALSAAYVGRGPRIQAGAPFEGAGKRAAFSLFFAPLHFIAVHHAVREIDFDKIPVSRVWDMGCGTGAGGAAWAVAAREALGDGAGEAADEAPRSMKILGVDRSGFALEEAQGTYRAMGVACETRRADLSREIPRGKGAALFAYTLNELDERARDRLLAELRRGTFRPLLVVEPVAKRIAPWWARWERALGQEVLALHAFEWRKRLELPEWIASMDRAAGLNHSELTARVLGILG